MVEALGTVKKYENRKIQDFLFLFLFALVLCVVYGQTLFFVWKKPLVLGGANENSVVFDFILFVRRWVDRIFNIGSGSVYHKGFESR